MSFLDLSSLGLTSTPSQLLATWLAYMQAAYPGYVPSAANPEYVNAQAIAALGADVAQTGLVVPDAIWRAFGTKLAQVVYLQGLPALASVQVTAVDSTGYTLPAASTSLTLGTLGFVPVSDLVIAPGSTTGTMTVAAAAVGAAYNGATNPVELQATVNWVASITCLGAASGGVDPESDTDYENRLVAQLRLQAPRPITAGDYATMALSFSPSAGTDQQEIGRATSIDGYQKTPSAFTVTTVSGNATATVTAPPGTGITAAQGAYILGSGIPSATFTANTTSGGPTLAAVSSFANIGVGALVTGTGIPANTTIIAVNTGASTATLSQNATATNTGTTVTVSTTLVLSSTATTIVMSQNATASAAGVTATVTGTLGNERTVTVGVTLANGTATNADTKTALAAWLATFREINFIVNAIDPTYTTVYVTSSVHLFPGFDPTAAGLAIQAALTAYLSPSNFQLPPFGNTAAWLQGTVIRYSRLIAIVENVPGVDYVPVGSLKVGTAASPSGTSDLTLPGPIALPLSTNTSVPVPTIV